MQLPVASTSMLLSSTGEELMQTNLGISDKKTLSETEGKTASSPMEDIEGTTKEGPQGV